MSARIAALVSGIGTPNLPTPRLPGSSIEGWGIGATTSWRSRVHKSATYPRMLALTACLALISACSSPAAPTPVVAAVDLPPAGSMWFGSSFDLSTFALTGRTTTIKFGSPVAFVAHLSRKSTGEVVGLELNIGGVAATWPGGQPAAGSDVMGEVLPAAEVFQPGPLVVRVVDAGGNTLSSGTVMVSP